MNNYDKILREKESGLAFDISQQQSHWQNMEQQMKTEVPTLPTGGGVKLATIIKIAVIAAAAITTGVLAFKFFTKSKKPFNGVLKPSNIPSQFFTIDNNKDETIRTSHNSILKIKKGTFKTDKPVTVEIKEVFTPQEILQSGLTTTSSGKPLKSAGMMYFNASAEGNKIEPNIPINTFIPAAKKDTAMQVFKGEMQSDSTVNWVEPEIISDTISKDQEHLISWGRQLFLSKCASCHNIWKDGTGPALKNLSTNPQWENPVRLKQWINNVPSFIANDNYTKDLMSKYGSMMTAFPDINENDIASLLSYINYASANQEQEEQPLQDSETKRDPIDTAGTFKNDCGNDTTYYSIENDFQEYDTTGLPIIPYNGIDTVGDMIYDYREYAGIYKQGYDIAIDANGWYNIDAFLKTERKDTEEVSLSAEIVNGEGLPYNLYVFVPSERVLQPYTTKKGNTYTFSFENNKIPLPKRYRAVVLAFGSSGQKLQYGVAEFIIQKEQQLKITLQETTKEGFLNVLYTHNINGVSIDAVEKEMYVAPIACPGSATAPASDTSKAKAIGAPIMERMNAK